jgi:tellurite resistance protein TerC
MKTLKQLRRLVVAVVGFTVLAIGVVLIVLPGPAFIVIPAGLAILAAEFAWAANLLNRIKEKLKKVPGGNIFRPKSDNKPH